MNSEELIKELTSVTEKYSEKSKELNAIISDLKKIKEEIVRLQSKMGIIEETQESNEKK